MSIIVYFILSLYTISTWCFKTAINLIIDGKFISIFSSINIDAMDLSIHSEYKYVFLLSLYLGVKVFGERYTLP